MADNTVDPGNTPENLSPEEMAKRRAEITAYYEEHIPSLKIQLEYETILRDIEKMRAERLQAQTFITRTMAEPPAPPAAPVNPANAEMKKAFDNAAEKGAKAAPKKKVLKKKVDAN